MTRAALAAGAMALLASCTHVGTFDPKHFQPWQIAEDKKLEGRALVLTAAEADGYVYSGRPASFVGSANTLTLPLGLLVREAAKRVFGELFLGGADASNDASHLEGYRAVVSPRLVGFTYQYGWSALYSPSGQFALSIRVALLNASGAVVFEKIYESGLLEATGSAQVDAPEAISRGAHVAAQTLMLQAAADLRERLAPQAAPPALPSPGAAADPAGSGGSAP